ncbi:MAG: FKBP-type peptidyl-prolyl cis-trans isomerase [Paludibacteraceae bacterium]|nr:FKBP-type peptidyl-prolyl cis-trans isomerase [Paludibacteraceae bacterium]
MDSKMIVKGERFLIFLSIFILQFSISSCKKNNWADWKVQNEVWLEANKQKEGVIETSSGLQYKIIADPTPQDARPNTTSTIVCDYSVKLINGYQVDAGNNVQLSLPNTISGFTEGCHKIHCNGDIELYIPAYLGYDQSKYESNEYGEAEGFGTEGTQSFIPPYSTLIYSIHLCSVSE